MHVCVCIGGMPQPPAAVFKSLPPRQILTLNFDAPEMWLVEPVIAEHDLDNLKLEQLGDSPTLKAEYELEALMLTGRCMDLHARRRELVSKACMNSPSSSLSIDHHIQQPGECTLELLAMYKTLTSTPFCSLTKWCKLAFLSIRTVCVTPFCIVCDRFWSDLSIPTQ